MSKRRFAKSQLQEFGAKSGSKRPPPPVTEKPTHLEESRFSLEQEAQEAARLSIWDYFGHMPGPHDRPLKGSDERSGTCDMRREYVSDLLGLNERSSTPGGPMQESKRERRNFSPDRVDLNIFPSKHMPGGND